MFKGVKSSINDTEVNNTDTNDIEIDYGILSPFTYNKKYIDIKDIKTKRNLDLDALFYNNISFAKIYIDQTYILKRAGIKNIDENSDTLELYAYNEQNDLFAIFFANAKGIVSMITFKVTKTGRYTQVTKTRLSSLKFTKNETNSKKSKAVLAILPNGFQKLL